MKKNKFLVVLFLVAVSSLNDLHAGRCLGNPAKDWGMCLTVNDKTMCVTTYFKIECFGVYNPAEPDDSIN